MPYLDASGKEDFTLAMAKRVLASVTSEIEARVLAHGASRLQASPVETRVLLGTTMVVGVRRARIGVGSKPAMAVLSNWVRMTSVRPRMDTHSRSMLDSQTHGDECGSGSHVGGESKLILDGKRM